MPDVATMLWLLGQYTNGTVFYWYDGDTGEHCVEIRGEDEEFRDDTMEGAFRLACGRQMNRGNTSEHNYAS